MARMAPLGSCASSPPQEVDRGELYHPPRMVRATVPSCRLRLIASVSPVDRLAHTAHELRALRRVCPSPCVPPHPALSPSAGEREEREGVGVSGASQLV